MPHRGLELGNFRGLVCMMCGGDVEVVYVRIGIWIRGFVQWLLVKNENGEELCINVGNENGMYVLKNTKSVLCQKFVV